MAGETIDNIRRASSEIDFRVVAVHRDGNIYPPTGETRLFVGDEISVIIAEDGLDTLLPLLVGGGSYKNVFIAGGGNIGERVARQIYKNSRVKIIEASQERCADLSASLDSVLVIKGGASDEHMLREENISDTDVYCALTNDDKENILSSMLAKRMGARRNIVLVNRASYAGILIRLLDNVVSPAEISIGAILAHIRAGDVGVVHSLHHGKAEVIEAAVHGTSESSEVVGRTVGEIEWPESATPGALIRDDRMIIAHDTVRLQDGDRLIVFAAGGKATRKLGKMLQVSAHYF